MSVAPNAVVRAFLALVPARWRESVIRDLEEEARQNGWGPLRIAWHAARIAVTIRWHSRRSADEAPARRHLMDELRKDILFALRLAARTPLFTGLAIMTLALGVGANAAVFGVTKSVLLDPLPYADGDRLVLVHGRSAADITARIPLSAGAVMDFAARETTLERHGLFYPTTWERTYQAPGGAQAIIAGQFAPGFLETLGVTPAIGRSFADGESPTTGMYVAMLSHETWQREFGADPVVIGQTIRVDTDDWEIVGILPQGFTGPMGSADLWFPLDISSNLADPARARQNEWLGLVARLAPGETVASARRDLSSIAARLAVEHPDTDAGRTVSVVSLRESMVGDTRTPLLVLMGGAILVLVIACANLAGALLSRTIGRRGEIAVRVALGAGRGRLTRQLLTESLTIAAAGLAVGVLLANVGLRALRAIDVPALPRYADLSLDAGAVLFATALAVCTGIAIGLVPAVTAFRSNTQQSLRDSSRSLSAGRRPGLLRGGLLSTQIALCLSLLFGAGLLTRSLVAMAHEPLGFDPDAVLTFSVKGPMPKPDAVRRQFFEDLEARIQAMPGVIAVANTNALPGPAMARTALSIEDAARSVGRESSLVPVVTVSDEWFRTMHIPLLQGRTFGPADGLDTTPVVVISEALARSLTPDGSAIGTRLRLGADASTPWSEVVGVAGDVRTDPAELAPEPVVYAAARQSLLRESRIYSVRAAGDASSLTLPVQAEIRRLDPTVPMSAVSTLHGLLDARLNVHRLPAFLMGTFATLALILAAVGVYALIGNLTAAREPEFSLRIALGSSPAAIMWLVLRFGGLWTLIGLAGGALGIAAIGYALRDLLYVVSPLDPVTIGAAILAILGAIVIALITPIRRTLRLDACIVLR